MLHGWLIGKSGASDTGSVSNIEFESTDDNDDDSQNKGWLI